MKTSLKRQGSGTLASGLLFALAAAVAFSWTTLGQGKPPGGGGGGTTPLPNYQISFLGTLGGSRSFANGINSNGDVVGVSDAQPQGGYDWQFGFVSVLGGDGNRTMINLQTLFESEGLIPALDYNNPFGSPLVTDANDINDYGQIVGMIQIAGDATSPSISYRYTPGYTDENGEPVAAQLDYIPTAVTGGGVVAKAIKNNGFVTGYLTNPSEPSQPFVWSEDAGTVALPLFDGRSSWGMDINASGQIAGMSDTWYRAWRYTPGTGYQNLGAPKGRLGVSAGFSINDLGAVAGGTYNGSSYRIFRYTNAEGMKDLGTLGGASSRHGAINNLGQVVGSSQTASGAERLCLYTDATGLGNLEAAITNLPGGLSSLSRFRPLINDAAEVCGTADFADGSIEAYVLTPTP